MQIVSRAEWGALPADPPNIDMTTPAVETWAHHAAFDWPDEAEMMRDIQLAHMHLGYRDFGYNFGFGNSGKIYVGRGWGKVNGADGTFHDFISHTWCFLGNSNITPPSLKALDAVREHIAFGIAEGHIRAGTHPTGGHRDIDNTACPGELLYAKLDYLREDDMTAEEVEQIVSDLTGISVNSIKARIQFTVGMDDFSRNRPRDYRGPEEPNYEEWVRGWDLAAVEAGTHDHGLVGEELGRTSS
jgi:hypothetical protein